MMRKEVVLLVFLVLIITCNVAGQGLPNLGEQASLPDPGEYTGSKGILFESNYEYENNFYDVYQYSFASEESDLIFAYSIAANLAGFEVEISMVSGYKALLIYNLGKASTPAMLFPDYQGYVLFMVPSGLKFSPYIYDINSAQQDEELSDSLPDIYTDSTNENLSPSEANEIGNRYAKGEGVEQNFSEAVSYYRISAEEGDPEGQYNYGLSYYNGNGVNQDYNEALKWFRLAADQGNNKAQFNIGLSYYYGEGVIQDFVEAVKWFRLSAEQGNDKAQYAIGTCYYNGEGVTQDYIEGVKWIRLSAEQGNDRAQGYLGVCYIEGKGVKQDYGEAAKWLLESAVQNNPASQYGLGMLYESGLGVNQNFEEAEKWYQKALAHEYDEEIDRNLKRVQNYLLLDAEPIPSGSGTIIQKGDVGTLLRKTPSFSGESLMTIFNGERINFLGAAKVINGTKWVYVETQSGQEGWIPGYSIYGFNL